MRKPEFDLLKKFFRRYGINRALFSVAALALYVLLYLG